jgi:hypothetical protein
MPCAEHNPQISLRMLNVLEMQENADGKRFSSTWQNSDNKTAHSDGGGG